MWLKVERLVSIHVAVVKEMQTNLREFLSEPEVEDNWLDASPADMEKIRDLIQEDLVKPTANLADLMYKSVEIRDSRHSLQLNTSMWRLSWITFIFLPLTFISSFFGFVNIQTELTAGEQLITKQYERRHIPIRSGCKILLCIRSSSDGRGPGWLVYSKACSCKKEADSKALFRAISSRS